MCASNWENHEQDGGKRACEKGYASRSPGNIVKTGKIDRGTANADPTPIPTFAPVIASDAANAAAGAVPIIRTWRITTSADCAMPQTHSARSDRRGAPRAAHKAKCASKQKRKNGVLQAHFDAANISMMATNGRLRFQLAKVAVRTGPNTTTVTAKSRTRCPATRSRRRGLEQSRVEYRRS